MWSTEQKKPLLPMIRIQAGKMNRIYLAMLSAILEHKGILWKLQSVAQFKGVSLLRHHFVSLGKFSLEALKSDLPLNSVHTSQADVTCV